MNELSKAKLRASFVTYLTLKNKPVKLSEYIDFLNSVNLGLGKSVSIDEMSSLVNKGSFTKYILKEKTKKGHYTYRIKK